jgi:D-sedoheptulose 7-phosphate isomerase
VGVERAEERSWASLTEAGEAYVREGLDLAERYLAEAAPAMARACWAMARRFHRGGRLVVFGTGLAASDAQHVAVEFIHPVIVGKRALPALCLVNDVGSHTDALRREGERALAALVRVVGRPEDIAFAVSVDGQERQVVEALAEARSRGMLTVAVAGGDGGLLKDLEIDHLFVVPHRHPHLVQEVQETLYHIVYELVHVFFEHRALLEEEVGTA